MGGIWVFDAEGIADPFAPRWRPLRWDPLEGCQDADVAIRSAPALVGARPMGGVRNGDFFSGAASGVLRGHGHRPGCPDRRGAAADMTGRSHWSGGSTPSRRT